MGLPARFCWLLVAGYRLSLAAVVGGNCRFYPSCSVFAQHALERQPFFVALLRIARRLSCCHPWHPGGFDPVALQKGPDLKGTR